MLKKVEFKQEVSQESEDAEEDDEIVADDDDDDDEDADRDAEVDDDDDDEDDDDAIVVSVDLSTQSTLQFSISVYHADLRLNFRFIYCRLLRYGSQQWMKRMM